MPTLSNIRFETLTILKWVGIVLGVLLGLFLLIKILIFVKNVVAPSPTAPPAASFGKIPAPYFPQEPAGHFNYSIDTISGELPTLSDRAKVYKTVTSAPNLLAVKNVSSSVVSLGFDNNPEALSESVYRWVSGDPLNKILVLNVDMHQANLSSNFIGDPNVSTANNLPTQNQAVEMAKTFFTTLGVFPDDIDDSKTKTELVKIDNGAIVKASGLSSTQLISVYFFQKDMNGIPFVYPSGGRSSINATVAGGSTEPQIVDARFFYQKASNQSSDYSIKTAKEAYDELTKKGAYIARLDPGSTDIKIKKVYVALYQSGHEQKYIEPVIVFEGDRNFVGYIPALRGEWLSN